MTQEEALLEGMLEDMEDGKVLVRVHGPRGGATFVLERKEDGFVLRKAPGRGRPGDIKFNPGRKYTRHQLLTSLRNVDIATTTKHAIVPTYVASENGASGHVPTKTPHNAP